MHQTHIDHGHFVELLRLIIINDFFSTKADIERSIANIKDLTQFCFVKMYEYAPKRDLVYSYGRRRKTKFTLT